MTEYEIAKARKIEERRKKSEQKNAKYTLDYYAPEQDEDNSNTMPGQTKLPKGIYTPKRVSLSHDQLMKNLFELFK